MSRTCKECGETKTWDEFANAGKVKGVQYRRHVCRKCWYENTIKQKRYELRDWFNDIKRDLICNRCGFDDWRAIQFHHRDESLKEGNLSNMVHSQFSKDNILKEMEKCEILCANCHQIHHSSYS